MSAASVCVRVCMFVCVCVYRYVCVYLCVFGYVCMHISPQEEEEVFKQTDENIQIELEQVVSRLELKNPQEVMTKAFE